MKVMILANFDVGLYQFRKELIQRLLEDNEVYISLPYGELIEPLKELGCVFIDTKLDRRGINPFKDMKLFFTYLKILRKISPDLVITYTIKPNVYGGAACSLLHIPYAINITGLGSAFENEGLLKKIVTCMNKIACKKAKVVFFENEENRRIFIEQKIAKEQKTYRLNGAGVNLEKYQLLQYPEGEKTIFLFMGRVMEEKGINELFDAMKILKKEGYNCELHVIGAYEENYKDVIAKYENEGWLHYYGYQKDVRPFIKECHCFVLPSWHEGMANTNLESAASGRPVITSDIPGCQEAVADGVTGYLVERKNVNSLYSAMKRFMLLTYDERKQMGLMARQRMVDIFDKNKVVEETISQLFKA